MENFNLKSFLSHLKKKRETIRIKFVLAVFSVVLI